MLNRSLLTKITAVLLPYGHQSKFKFSVSIKEQEVVKLPRVAAPLKCGTPIQDLKNQLRIVLGQETGNRTILFRDRENLNAYLAKKTTDLPSRCIRDSFLSAVIPLKSDSKLQEQYASVSGDLRYGRLVEDIDIFADVQTPEVGPYRIFLKILELKIFRKVLSKQSPTGPKYTWSIELWNRVYLVNNTVYHIFQFRFPPFLITDHFINIPMIAHKYILNPFIPIFDPSPYTVVTVLVDSLMFNFLAKPTEDINISGHIANVGRSSAIVVVRMDQRFGDQERNITKAKLLVAIRDANNKSAALINPLKPGSESEQLLLNKAREAQGKTNRPALYELAHEMPTPQEHQALHDIALKSCGGSLCRDGKLPGGYRWMADTALTSNIIAFPDDKNVHNTVFAGYLLRQMVELAYATCYRFCSQQGKFRGVTELRLYRSIPVGSILMLHGQIAFANERHLQVAMYADVLNKRDGLQPATNTFHMTVEVPNPVQNVIPKSYREAMLYLDAERRLERSRKHLQDSFHYIDFSHASGSLN